MLLLGLLLACRSSSQERCVAAIQYNEVRYSSLGTAKTKAEAEQSARSGACMAYCDWGDPSLDAAHKAWKATPAGARSTTERSFEIFVHLKAEKAACMSHCNAAVRSGTAQVKVVCP